MKRMLFNATHPEETRVGIVDGQKLIDIDIETAGREARKSNIYKGVVTRIEPSLEACFVNYGEERHGFLPFKEISRQYFKEGVDVRTATIKDAITEGQELIVQVEKEERGNKGAALTTFISLAGRYLVLMPNNPRAGGVSRRIEGEERQELREAMERLDVPSGMSTIARTAGIGRTTEELQWDLNYLLKLWRAIEDAAQPQYELVTEENGKRRTNVTTEAVMNGRPLKRLNPAPYLIVEESNLVVRAIRDYFQPEIGEVLVDTDEIYEQVRQFMAHVMPDMISRVKRYRDDIPLFTRFQIEQQIETAYSRTVPLPSGGAIVIDHTEALVAIDVNSARATRGADIEETAFRTNCEAADEVARQMRLRDLGGLIVIDFIDMSDPKNQRAVEQRLKDAIRFDRARVQIAKISRFGLMELSRQRLRPALSEGNHITCPRCNGVGVIRDTESCAIQVLRILQEEAMKEGTGAVEAQVPVDVATFLLNEKRNDITKLEARHRVPIVLVPNTFLETPHYHIERIRQDDERLDKHAASFTLVEEIDTKATDPYAQKSAEDKPARPKQVPVIKNVMIEREPAPVHQPKPAEAPEAAADAGKPAQLQPVEPKKGFFARIASFLFGDKTEAPKAQEEKTQEPKRERGAKSEKDDKRRGDRRRGSRTRREDAAGERTERGERRGSRRRTDRLERAQAEKLEKTEKAEALKAEKVEKSEAVQKTDAAKPEAEKTERRARRSRRARSEDAQAPEAPKAAPVESTEAPAEAPAAALEPAEAAPAPAQQTPAADEAEKKQRRPRRRRRAPEGAEGEQAAPAAVVETPAADVAEVSEEAPAPAAQATTVDAAPEANAEAPAKLEEAAEAPEAPAAEDGEKKRRPRRRRRKNPAEGEAADEQSTAAPASEPKQAEGEKLVQIETKPIPAPAAEAAEAPEQAERKEDADGKAEQAQKAEKADKDAQPTVKVIPEYAYDDGEALIQIETKPSALSMAVRDTFHAAETQPQRRRRSRKPKNAEASAEARAEAAPQTPAEEPKLEQVETAPMTAAEPAGSAAAEPAAVEAIEATAKLGDIAEGLEANLARAGLVQVHTAPRHNTVVSYAPVVYPGRPMPQQAAQAVEEALVQVETRKELAEPYSYQAARYPGRPMPQQSAEAVQEQLIQVETRKA